MPDLLITGARELATCRGPAPRLGEAFNDAGVIADGAVAIRDGQVVAVGPTPEVLAQFPPTARTKVVDATGCLVTPGLVDSHTHLVFAGSRAADFRARIEGERAGTKQMSGGINTTMRATREAGLDQLVALGEKRLATMLQLGTTSCEVKSGYGPDRESELKILEAYRQLSERQPVELFPTFMGAHAIPPGMTAESQTELVIAMLPEAAPLAQFCDVFCEEGFFSVEQSRRILEAAKQFGLRPRIHADELADTGSAALAAEVGALSADHLLLANEDGLRKMAEAGVVAVLLPGTPFFLRLKERAPVALMRRLGVAIALATDFNPGSCYSESLPLMMTLACLEYQLTPQEVLVASTLHGALALGVADRLGSLEVGKQADVVVWDVASVDELPYHFGVPLAKWVVKRGRVVSGLATPPTCGV